MLQIKPSVTKATARLHMYVGMRVYVCVCVTNVRSQCRNVYGGGCGPCSSPGTERKYEKNTACVPDAQRPERGMEPVERVGCTVCWTA